ncbi:PepSY domain-containing protein [Olivibacter sp. XZL3]|uniref:PepSY-associated TM helix domain-containing protein n=1 Tax=Olivibacter sp. XZL3 TaxID=1735116 RepID=UPI00106539D6|nr:PepSY-associated TM helix domain-containing protein [Olivibacter sp. XZL3]
MNLKKIIAWLHLWLGLAVGLIFSIAAVTGALLVFEEELEVISYPTLYEAAERPVGARRLSLDELTALAGRYAGKQQVARFTINEENRERNVVFQTEGDRMERVFLGLDPYTGALRDYVPGKSHFFSVVEEIHRRLLMGDLGKAITGLCCLSYLLVLVTGLVIWWPKNAKMWKQRLKIKWDASSKRLNWDIHAVGGFYFFPILFVITLTGLTWSYKWFNNGIYLLFDGKGPQKVKTVFHLPKAAIEGAVLEKAYQQVQELLPYRGTVTVHLPLDKEEDVLEVTKEQEDAFLPNVVDRLFFNAYTGDLVHRELYVDQTRGMKVRRTIFPIHTGSIGGLVTKIIYVIAVLFGASLPFTGLFIWLGRKKKKKKSNTRQHINLKRNDASRKPVKSSV